MVKLGECQEYILSYPTKMDAFSGGFLLVLQGVATTPIYLVVTNFEGLWSHFYKRIPRRNPTGDEDSKGVY